MKIIFRFFVYVGLFTVYHVGIRPLAFLEKQTPGHILINDLLKLSNPEWKLVQRSSP